MHRRPLAPAVPLAAALAALGGCGDPAPAPKASPKESGYIARVQALTPGQLQGVLFRAIQSGGGGGQCHAVTRVEPMPPAKSGEPVWRVTCTGGGQWSVALADTGIAQVTGAATR